MKITFNSNNNPISYRPSPAKNSSTPSFGISFKPKLLKDFFIKTTTTSGISQIKNVHAGEFGTVCKGSKPLINFEDSVEPYELEKLYKKGISTNTEGWANCLLKSKADRPLSTSSVYDCSVMYLFNKKTNTHFLYHSYFDEKKETFDYLIKTFMPEGFTQARLIPGDEKWYPRHSETLTQMLKALRGNNKTANVKLYNYSSKLPEIVCYKGDVFEIPNERTIIGLSDKGQASFKICDLQIENLLSEMNANCTSSKKIEAARKMYKHRGYDREILKVFNRLLDERAGKIQEMEACQTIEELNKLLNSYTEDEKRIYFYAIKNQRLRILSNKNFDK